MTGPYTYVVQVDDNFHYMDESERYTHGTCATYDVAVAACQRIVDEYLDHAYRPGMTCAELLESYVSFGEDPWISTGDPAAPKFSARDYARSRVKARCGRSPLPRSD